MTQARVQLLERNEAAETLASIYNHADTVTIKRAMTKGVLPGSTYQQVRLKSRVCSMLAHLTSS